MTITIHHQLGVDPFDDNVAQSFRVTINSQPFKSAIAGRSMKLCVMDAILSVSHGKTIIEHYEGSAYWHIFTQIGYYLIEIQST